MINAIKLFLSIVQDGIFAKLIALLLAMDSYYPTSIPYFHVY